MRHLRSKFTLIIEKTNTGFSAYCDKYPVYTTGGSFTELLRNAVEAMNLFLEDQEKRITETNIEFEIDLKQFFQYYRVINSKFLARRIGMNETLLSQYVQGRKKPSPLQTNKILSGIQEIGRELTSIRHFSNSRSTFRESGKPQGH
jgi:predicted RNase H-like HicB family nuclease